MVVVAAMAFVLPEAPPPPPTDSASSSVSFSPSLVLLLFRPGVHQKLSGTAFNQTHVPSPLPPPPGCAPGPGHGKAADPSKKKPRHNAHKLSDQAKQAFGAKLPPPGTGSAEGAGVADAPMPILPGSAATKSRAPLLHCRVAGKQCIFACKQGQCQRDAVKGSYCTRHFNAVTGKQLGAYAAKIIGQYNPKWEEFEMELARQLSLLSDDERVQKEQERRESVRMHLERLNLQVMGCERAVTLVRRPVLLPSVLRQASWLAPQQGRKICG